MKAHRHECYKWLVAHVGHEGEGCLTWPFSLDRQGHGRAKHKGEDRRAHRLMCTLAHGDSPTPRHNAAHSCGKGHLGCVHPKHLSWKTQVENMADCIIHGTQPKQFGGARGSFTPEQVQEIRTLLLSKSQYRVAQVFGVHVSLISSIARGITYARPPKINFWSPEQEEVLRQGLQTGKPFKEIAKETGRDIRSVYSKASRIAT